MARLGTRITCTTGGWVAGRLQRAVYNTRDAQRDWLPAQSGYVLLLKMVSEAIWKAFT